MPEKALAPEQILGMLAAGAPRIEAATADLTAEQLRTRPAPDAWSATEVLAHLRSCGDVWGDCIRTILEEDSPTIRAINPTTWLDQTDYPSLDFQPSFQAFTRQRADLLAVLASLTPDQWARGATVTGAGRPLERTVLGYAQRLAIHERPHLKQMERLAHTLRQQ